MCATPSDVIERLEALENRGLSVSACAIEGLRDAVYDDFLSIPNISAVSRSVVRMGGSENAKPVIFPLLVPPPPEIALPLGHPHRDPVVIDASWIKAPAPLALPVIARRPLDGPLKIRLRAISPSPITLGASVKVHNIDDKVLEDTSTWGNTKGWQPMMEGAKDVQLQLVSHSSGLPRPLSAITASSDDSHQAEKKSWKRFYGDEVSSWKEIYCGETDVGFDRIAFLDPSQMGPRWLVVSISFTCGRCTAFLQLKIPTIVMSHAAQQTARAAAILWRHGRIPNPSLWTKPFQQTVERKFKDAGISRVLDRKDYSELARLAMHTELLAKKGHKRKRKDANNPEQKSSDLTEVETQAVEYFLNRTVDLIKTIFDHFHASDPVIISSFAMTRARAERLLANQRPSAFLLRFGTQAGSLVMSVNTGGSQIAHIRLRGSDIRKFTLEQLLAQDGRGVWLLDPMQMMLYRREMVLPTGYIDPIALKNARDDYFTKRKAFNGASIVPAMRLYRTTPTETNNQSGVLSQHADGVSHWIEHNQRYQEASVLCNYQQHQALLQNPHVLYQQSSQQKPGIGSMLQATTAFSMPPALLDVQGAQAVQNPYQVASYLPKWHNWANSNVSSYTDAPVALEIMSKPADSSSMHFGSMSSNPALRNPMAVPVTTAAAAETSMQYVPAQANNEYVSGNACMASTNNKPFSSTARAVVMEYPHWGTMYNNDQTSLLDPAVKGAFSMQINIPSLGNKAESCMQSSMVTDMRALVPQSHPSSSPDIANNVDNGFETDVLKKKSDTKEMDQKSSCNQSDSINILHGAETPYFSSLASDPISSTSGISSDPHSIPDEITAEMHLQRAPLDNDKLDVFLSLYD